MQITALEIWAYGMMMMLGGIMGYVKVGSKASLLSGVGMGLALLASGYGVWHGSRNSLIAAVVIAALLVVLFAMRLAKTKRFMPAGVLAILSLAAVIIFGLALKK
ncbi:MAG TPA: TMEM14 family protein [Verrucomicrobiae bacterium]|nr:TMEM14 family protein [Verrucomicrobiae bacterium]